jgi:hypothetical protein
MVRGTPTRQLEQISAVVCWFGGHQDAPAAAATAAAGRCRGPS